MQPGGAGGRCGASAARLACACGAMAVAEEDLSLLPVADVDPKFARAYENPRFVPVKGGAPVLAQVAPGGDIATVRDDGRLPDDSKQGFSGAFTGLLVVGQPVRASYCGVCQMWFGKFMDRCWRRAECHA